MGCIDGRDYNRQLLRDFPLWLFNLTTPDAGVQQLINSDYRNDNETHEPFGSEIMPHFA
jgi:hypothetical protein